VHAVHGDCDDCRRRDHRHPCLGGHPRATLADAHPFEAIDGRADGWWRPGCRSSRGPFNSARIRRHSRGNQQCFSPLTAQASEVSACELPPPHEASHCRHQLFGQLLRLAVRLSTDDTVTGVVVEKPQGDLVERRLDG